MPNVSRIGPDFRAGISTQGNTAGSTGLVNGSLLLVGASNLTLSQSTNGSSATLSLIAASQTAQTAHVHDVTLTGNTAGVLAAISSGTLTLAGGPNITLSQAGNVITISAGAAGVFSGGLSSIGNTSGNTGTVSNQLVFAGGNNVTLSGSTAASGATITISAANETQTVPPIGTSIFPVASANSTGTITRFAAEDHRHAGINSVSVVGNTAGNTSAGAGSVVLAGGNNVTLSGSTAAGGMTLTVSAANETQTVPPIGTQVFSVASANSTGTITRFAPEDHRHAGVNSVSVVGNTAGNTSAGAGSLVLAGGNNVTLSGSTAAGGMTVTVSAANETQTVPPIGTQVFSVASANSTGTITRFAPEDHRHAGVNSISVVGNTAGNTTAGAGSLIIAGGNNITISGSTAAGGMTLTVSGANAGGAQTGISSVAASGGTQTVGMVSFINSNNITFGMSTGANTGSVTASFSQSVQPAITAAVAGQSQTTGMLSFSNANGVSFGIASGAATGTLTASVSQTVQTQNMFNLTLSTSVGGATSGTMAVVSSGTLSLVAGNNITLSQSATNTIVISGQTVPPIGTQVFAVASAGSTGTITRFAPEDHRHAGLNTISVAGNTAGNTSQGQGSLILAGGNNITLSGSTAAGGMTLTISAANETLTVPPIATAVNAVASAGSTGTITRFAPEDHRHAGLNTISVVGNTAGNTSQGQGSLILAGGNNITLSGSTAAGGMTLTISGPNAGGAQTGISSVAASGGTQTVGMVSFINSNNFTFGMSTGANTGSMTASFSESTHAHTAYSAGISTQGNTSGTTGFASASLQLVGSNNITLSQSTSNNGVYTITISGLNAYSAGISTQGNTAGTTGFASASLQLVGSNLITLSQSTAAGQNTVTIVGPRIPGITRFDNNPDVASASNAGLYSPQATVNGSMWLFPLTPSNDLFPGNMSALSMFFDMSGSSFTSASAAQTLRGSLGIYTLAGASTLSLLNSGSMSITQGAATANTSIWHGLRWMSMVSSQFSASLTFSQTSYWLGLILSSSVVTQSLSHFGWYQGQQTLTRSGTMGVAGGSNASNGPAGPWAGIVGTAALPTSIHISGVTKTGASGGFVHHVVLEALHSAW